MLGWPLNWSGLLAGLASCSCWPLGRAGLLAWLASLLGWAALLAGRAAGWAALLGSFVRVFPLSFDFSSIVFSVWVMNFNGVKERHFAIYKFLGMQRIPSSNVLWCIPALFSGWSHGCFCLNHKSWALPATGSPFL